MIRLPGTCKGCHTPVMWTGTRWQDTPVIRGKGRRHACPIERELCGAWMRYVHERCARRPGHRWEHRSPYAMQNARMAA